MLYQEKWKTGIKVWSFSEVGDGFHFVLNLIMHFGFYYHVDDCVGGIVFMTLLRSFAFECSQLVKKVTKKEQHLWKENESAGSGKKALILVKVVSFVGLTCSCFNSCYIFFFFVSVIWLKKNCFIDVCICLFLSKFK